jgi:tRNA (adenine57-N1/adenine58-N1)-methyltransferase
MVTLTGPRGKFIVKISGEMQNVKGLGVVDTSRFIDKQYGDEVEIADQIYMVLMPSLMDKIETLHRKAQIILPKDAFQLVGMCNVSSGSVVIEGGAGSGALTMVLAHFVAPSGKVITYDNREDFSRIARKNLEHAGLLQYVEFKIGDAADGFSEKSVDAVLMDIPEPWDAVEHAWNALKPGGYLAAYVPTTNQVERFVHCLKEHHFIEIRTVENLQRELVVSDGGVRPSFEMLGHTGYSTVARKIL